MTFVPETLKLCTAEPAFVTTILPLTGAAMVAGVIANSLSVTCIAAGGGADLAAVGVRGDDECEEAEHQSDEAQRDPRGPDGITITTREQRHSALLVDG